MKRFYGFNIMCIVVLLFALLAPTAALAEKKATATPPGNAAIVNGKMLNYDDFQRELQIYQRHKQSAQEQITAEQANKEVINDMINRELIFQESVKKGIKVDAQTVNEEISVIQGKFGDQSQYDGWLASIKMTEGKLKEEISQRLAIRRLIESEIAPKVKNTESETKDFYTNNPKLFQRPEEVHAQHILIKVDKDADSAQKASALKKIQELKKKIDASEEFNALAKAHSQCPSAENNGDLGFFSRGRMVPAFEKAAFELKAGQVSGIVETPFGYHLIKVLERRESEIVKFEEVKTRISEELRNRRIHSEILQYLEGLRKNAKIETFVQ